jgi:hypothetical protein
MVLTVLDMQKNKSKFSCFNMNDVFNMVPTNKDIVYLKNVFDESDDEESDDKESEDEESDDKEGCHEESDDKGWDRNDENPLFTVLDDSTNVDLEVSNEVTYDLDLSLSAVANVIAGATFTTGAHILKSKDIWIVDTGGATSHVSPSMQKAEQSIIRQVFKYRDLQGKWFNLTARWIFQLLTLTRTEQRSLPLYLELFRQIRSFITTYSV